MNNSNHDNDHDYSEDLPSFWELFCSCSYSSFILDNNGSTARDHLANERTYLAWVRTALGLVRCGYCSAQTSHRLSFQYCRLLGHFSRCLHLDKCYVALSARHALGRPWKVSTQSGLNSGLGSNDPGCDHCDDLSQSDQYLVKYRQ